MGHGDGGWGRPRQEKHADVRDGARSAEMGAIGARSDRVAGPTIRNL